MTSRYQLFQMSTESDPTSRAGFKPVKKSSRESFRSMGVAPRSLWLPVPARSRSCASKNRLPRRTVESRKRPDEPPGLFLTEGGVPAELGGQTRSARTGSVVRGSHLSLTHPGAKSLNFLCRRSNIPWNPGTLELGKLEPNQRKGGSREASGQTNLTGTECSARFSTIY